MGVDYSPVGGIGIKIEGKIKNKLIVANDGESYDGDMDSLCGDLDLTCSESGDGNYTGDENDWYIMVEGETLMEINKNAPKLIEKLSGYGINIKMGELKVIQELCIW